jgi:hypothetical protein
MATLQISPGWMAEEHKASEEMFKLLCAAAGIDDTITVHSITCKVSAGGRVSFEIEKCGKAATVLEALGKIDGNVKNWVSDNTVSVEVAN